MQPTKNLIQSLLIALAILAGIHQAAAQGATVFPIATNAALPEFGGGIANSSSNYLVGILSGTNVCVQLVSINGTLIGSLNTIGQSKGEPQIAFARTTGNYLVVWLDDFTSAPLGEIVSSSGVPSGAPFSLANEPRTAASDGTNFLVVLADSNRYFYGQFLTGGGALSGSPFLISSQQQNGGSAAAAFGKTNYLVAWQSNNGSVGETNLTFGAFVSENGAVSAPIQIGQTSSVDQNALATAFDGTNFLVAWNWHAGPETEGSVTNWEIFGRLISLTGAFPGNELQLITDPGNDVYPSLAFGGSDYLLAWGYGLNVTTNTNIRFQFFDRTASPVGSEFSVFTPQGTNAPLTAFPDNGLLFDGTRFVVAATLGVFGTSVYANGLSSGEVFGAFISPLPTLTVLSSPVYFPNGQFQMTVNGSSGQNDTIQVSTDLSNGNWAALLVTNAPSSSFQVTDPKATNQQRFYRVLVGQ